MLLCTNLFRACDMPCFTTEKQPLGAVRRCRCCWMGGRTGGLGDEMLDKFMDYFKQLVTGWWFEIFLCSSLFGEMIQFDSYFWDGLKPPTRLSFASPIPSPRRAYTKTESHMMPHAWFQSFLRSLVLHLFFVDVHCNTLKVNSDNPHLIAISLRWIVPRCSKPITFTAANAVGPVVSPGMFWRANRRRVFLGWRDACCLWGP